MVFVFPGHQGLENPLFFLNTHTHTHTSSSSSALNSLKHSYPYNFHHFLVFPTPCSSLSSHSDDAQEQDDILLLQLWSVDVSEFNIQDNGYKNWMFRNSPKYYVWIHQPRTWHVWSTVGPPWIGHVLAHFTDAWSDPDLGYLKARLTHWSLSQVPQAISE